MSEMLKRVAQALVGSPFLQPEAHHYAMARNAILAMRELDLVGSVHLAGLKAAPRNNGREIEAIWTAMIDAALKAP